MRAADYPYFPEGFCALAHRGGTAAGADVENSLAAFASALELGFTHLETDVHATADGVLVAFHDDRLDRVTDASGAVAALPWAALREARIGGREPIPTLDEVLDAFPDARLNIDIKADAAVVPLARTLARHAAQERVCVGSFSTRRLRAFRRLAGSLVATSVDPAGVAWYAFGYGVRRVAAPAGQALQIPVREERTGVPLVSRPLIRAAHRAGRVVHVWTINDPAEMHRLIDLGVDGLVSDEVTVLRDVLVARGLWGR
nr:glycerophosphodiester phosphodiesterase [Propionibacterium sp.]